jgi:hypothetical protein
MSDQRIDEIREQLDSTPMLRYGGGFNPRYTRLKAELAELEHPGRLFRQLQLATMIGPQFETLAALLDVQLKYAEVMLKTYDWSPWYDSDIERIEQWVAAGRPDVDVNAWRANGAGIK